jgi:hypothetical protein
VNEFSNLIKEFEEEVEIYQQIKNYYPIVSRNTHHTYFMYYLYSGIITLKFEDIVSAYYHFILSQDNIRNAATSLNATYQSALMMDLQDLHEVLMGRKTNLLKLDNPVSLFGALLAAIYHKYQKDKKYILSETLLLSQNVL